MFVVRQKSSLEEEQREQQLEGQFPKARCIFVSVPNRALHMFRQVSYVFRRFKHAPSARVKLFFPTRVLRNSCAARGTGTCQVLAGALRSTQEGVLAVS